MVVTFFDGTVKNEFAKQSENSSLMKIFSFERFLLLCIVQFRKVNWIYFLLFLSEEFLRMQLFLSPGTTVIS